MSSNYKLETDLDEAEAMANHLEEYVRGDQLYGHIGGMFSRQPSLTIGALLMRLRRLDTLRKQMPDNLSKRLDSAVDTYDSTRREWRTHYEEKLLQEANSRIDAMRTFFQECKENPKLCDDIYRPEMSRRTIVQEVLKEMKELNLEDEALMNKIAAADARLHQTVQPSEFQWADELKDVYPEDEFWWLYQTPQLTPA